MGNRDLEGKNAIITGARSGIGLATLQLFAKNGCNCWAVVHREDDEFLNKIRVCEKEYNVWIKPAYIDLGDSESIRDGFKGIMSEKLPVDILVNAAGVVSPNRLFSMTKMEDIRNVMEVNFFSAIEASQLVCRAMMRQRKGSIINIASISACLRFTIEEAEKDLHQMIFAFAANTYILSSLLIPLLRITN